MLIKIFNFTYSKSFSCILWWLASIILQVFLFFLMVGLRWLLSDEIALPSLFAAFISCAVPQLFCSFLLIVLRPSGSPKMILRRCYWVEILKWSLTIVLGFIMLRVIPVQGIAFALAWILSQLASLLALAGLPKQ